MNYFNKPEEVYVVEESQLIGVGGSTTDDFKQNLSIYYFGVPICICLNILYGVLYWKYCGLFTVDVVPIYVPD